MENQKKKKKKWASAISDPRIENNPYHEKGPLDQVVWVELGSDLTRIQILGLNSLILSLKNPKRPRTL